MTEQAKPHTPSSATDGDGVRAVPTARASRGPASGWVIAAVVVVVAGIAAWWLASRTADVPADGVPASYASPTSAAPAAASMRGATGTPSPAMSTTIPNSDPNDLASYFRPGDPEPTGAELIEAMHELGIREGIGAFNPPGTSPPLEGLAVPEDFELPEGYVRHHQSTDDGASIDPILMFAPDAVLFGPDGKPIPLPENRVVPPELAPPGMPLRRVRIPPG